MRNASNTPRGPLVRHETDLSSSGVQESQVLQAARWRDQSRRLLLYPSGPSSFPGPLICLLECNVGLSQALEVMRPVFFVSPRAVQLPGKPVSKLSEQATGGKSSLAIRQCLERCDAVTPGRVCP